MADRFWVASTSQSFSDTTYWSTTSGGSGGASVPGSSDTAIFDANGTGDCTVSASITIVGLSKTSGNTGNLIISSGVVLKCTSDLSVIGGTVTINGTLRSDTTVSALTASYAGSGKVYIANYSNNKTIYLSFDTSNFPIHCYAQANNTTWLFSASTKTFNGYIKFEQKAGYTGGSVDSNTNNPDIILKDDLTILGDITWSKGTGTITASGTADQSWDFSGSSVEDIYIDKTSGTVTLTGDVNPDTLTLTSGTLDIDGNNITTAGAFTQAFGTTCQDTAGGGLISVGGNFAINGTSVNPCVLDGPDLDVTGTAEASWTTVTDSNASTGTTVDATNNCTDGGGNDSGWNFGSTSPGYRKGFLNMQDSQNMGVLLQI